MKPRNPAKAAEKKGVALVSEDVIPIKPAIEPARQQNFGKQFMATKGPPQIFLVALLSSISYGVIYGILPKVMMQRFAELKHGYSGPDCESFGSDEIKPDACRLGSIDAQNAHSISEFVAQLFIVATGPVVGGLSDIHGRKTLFALATLASLLGNFGFFYVYMRPQASPWVFYVLRGCHGMVSWQVTALASAADAVPPEFRAPVVGLVMAAFLGGLCIGPVFAMMLGRVYSAYFSPGLGIVSLIVAVFFVPETLSPEAAEEASKEHEGVRSKKTIFGEIRYFVLTNFQGLKILNRNDFFRKLSILLFLNGMVAAANRLLLVYYVDAILAFSERDIAVMVLAYGVTTVIAQGGLMRPLNKRFGEKTLICACYVGVVVNDLIYGLSMTKGGIIFGNVVGAVTQIAFPTLMAVQANNVDASEQGRLQGAVQAMLALAAGLGPVVARYADHVAGKSFLGPGAMFLFCAVLQAIATYYAFLLPREMTDIKMSENGTKKILDSKVQSGINKV